MVVPDDIVFDAELLIAHADNEPDSDVVEEYLDAVAIEDATGYASCVNEIVHNVTINLECSNALCQLSNLYRRR